MCDLCALDLPSGDRVVDVNGLPTWDLSYADVVYQVQLSGLRLVLKVQSRDDDEIQRVSRRRRQRGWGTRWGACSNVSVCVY